MNIGGPANQVLMLMNGLPKERFTQKLIYGACGENEKDLLDIIHFEFEAKKLPSMSRNVFLLKDFVTFLKILKEIRVFRPDIVHTHTTKAGILGRLAVLISLHPCKVIHTYHGHLLYGYFSPIFTRLIIFIEKVLAFSTDILVAVGENIKNDLIEVGIGTRNRFRTIYPGFSLKLDTKLNYRSDNGKLSTDRLRCAFIGRVTSIKRPDRFVDIVELSHKQNLPIDFLIVGDGDLYQDTFERAKLRNLPIEFTGWQFEIEQMLSTIDIVILTSDNEGTPFSLIQAGMFGIPVVATNVGSVDEIVVHGKTGFLANPDSWDFFQYLFKISHAPQLRLEMGIEAARFTKRRFSKEQFLHAYNRLYRELA